MSNTTISRSLASILTGSDSGNTADVNSILSQKLAAGQLVSGSGFSSLGAGSGQHFTLNISSLLLSDGPIVVRLLSTFLTSNSTLLSQLGIGTSLDLININCKIQFTVSYSYSSISPSVITSQYVSDLLSAGVNPATVTSLYGSGSQTVNQLASIISPAVSWLLQ